jgi:pyruvate dehydrogenase complex dehydrogenase (E1) component
MKQLMAELVTRTVRELADDLPRDAIYAKAFARLEALIEPEPALTVRIAPPRVADVERALATVATATQRIRIVPDASLRDDALAVERWNRLHPDQEQRVPYVVAQLASAQGPIVAATDYMKQVPDMVGRWLDRPDRPYTVLGTDGWGRSDTRDALRDFFEVNAPQLAYAALHGLCQVGQSSPDELKRAIGELGIDPDRPNPAHTS